MRGHYTPSIHHAVSKVRKRWQSTTERVVGAVSRREKTVSSTTETLLIRDDDSFEPSSSSSIHFSHFLSDYVCLELMADFIPMPWVYLEQCLAILFPQLHHSVCRRSAVAQAGQNFLLAYRTRSHDLNDILSGNQ